MTVSTDTPAWQRRAALAVKVLLALLALALAGGVFLQTIRDHDFFWHLKTGQWIWEHRSLPREFLFSVTASGPMTEGQRFIMTSYWLSQVVIHLCHAAGGFTALAALRGVLLAAYLLAIGLRRRGDDIVFLGLLAPAIIVMGGFPLERPQVWSFVFMGVLLCLLDGVRTAATRRGLLLVCAGIPALMVAWANSHGGFFVGQCVLLLFLLCEAAKRLHPRLEPLPPDRFRWALPACAAGVLASLLNPNGIHVVKVALLPLAQSRAGNLGLTANQEYQSTLAVFAMGGNPELLPYWYLLALAAVAVLVAWRKPDLWQIGLLALVGYFSFTGMRHVPFLAVAALPVIGTNLSRKGVVGVARPLVALAALAWGAMFWPATVNGIRQAPRSAQVDPLRFPVGAAEFVERSGLRGNMFNDYGWGGYLEWRLPSGAAFIDGRIWDESLLETYMRVLQGDRQTANGQPYWKGVFSRYGIRYVVLPIYNLADGEVAPLLDALLAAPSWLPVHASGNAMVFAEEAPENRGVVERFAMAKRDFPQRLIDALGRQIRAAPWDVRPYVATGDLLARTGRAGEAVRAYRQALRLAPRHPYALMRLGELQRMGYR